MSRGGVREGAGRKGFYGEKTIAVKIPVSRVEDVKLFLQGNSVNLGDNLAAKKNSADCLQKLAEIELIMENWRSKCTPKRDKAARWEKANELFKDIYKVIGEESD